MHHFEKEVFGEKKSRNHNISQTAVGVAVRKRAGLETD